MLPGHQLPVSLADGPGIASARQVQDLPGRQRPRPSGGGEAGAPEMEAETNQEETWAPEHGVTWDEVMIIDEN